MTQPEYSPDFVEVLKAWERHPPLRAGIVFDLPPDDPRRTDKVGVLMYQAVLLRQDHPELDFDRIKAVTFTCDVHHTGDQLEKAAGHDLPQFRNAAARLDIFHVNLGGGQVLVITDEAAKACLSPQLPVRLAAWEMLRSELARCAAVGRLDASGLAAPEPGVQARWHGYARSVWIEYFVGGLAAVEGLSTDMARRRLRESLEQDAAALSQAISQFQRDHDRLELRTRAEGCVRGLGEAMAEVLGQLASAGTSLAALDPQLDTLVRVQGLSSLWDGLAGVLARCGRQPSQWDRAAPWDALIAVLQGCLRQVGLHYDDDGQLGQVPARS